MNWSRRPSPPPTRPDLPRLLSTDPPAGTVVVRGHGWRVAVPLAVLVGIASALGTRLVSTEQRLLEQSAHIRELERVCRK
jgi:hypothetical protein